MVNEPGEDVEIVLCDPCSSRMTDPKNWLGVAPLESPFDCVICAKTFCKHLRKDGCCAVCVDCGKD